MAKLTPCATCGKIVVNDPSSEFHFLKTLEGEIRASLKATDNDHAFNSLRMIQRRLNSIGDK